MKADTKLIFKQARVRNARMELRKIKSWFVDFDQTDFSGRYLTNEYHGMMLKRKFLTELLKHLEMELQIYLRKIRKVRKKECLHL